MWRKFTKTQYLYKSLNKNLRIFQSKKSKSKNLNQDLKVKFELIQLFQL